MKTIIITAALLAMSWPMTAQAPPPPPPQTTVPLLTVSTPAPSERIIVRPEEVQVVAPARALDRATIAGLERLMEMQPRRRYQATMQRFIAGLEDALDEPLPRDPLLDQMLLLDYWQSLQPQSTLPQTFEVELDEPFDISPERYRITIRP